MIFQVQAGQSADKDFPAILVFRVITSQADRLRIWVYGDLITYGFEESHTLSN